MISTCEYNKNKGGCSETEQTEGLRGLGIFIAASSCDKSQGVSTYLQRNFKLRTSWQIS